MKNKAEKSETKSLFEELFHNIFQLLNKIPQLLQPNKKLFAYLFLASWITLLVFTSFEIIKWVVGKPFNPSLLLFYMLCFFVLVLVPMLIAFFNEWEKRNNLLLEKMDQLIESKDKQIKEV